MFLTTENIRAYVDTLRRVSALSAQPSELDDAERPLLWGARQEAVRPESWRVSGAAGVRKFPKNEPAVQVHPYNETVVAALGIGTMPPGPPHRGSGAVGRFTPRILIANQQGSPHRVPSQSNRALNHWIYVPQKVR